MSSAHVINNTCQNLRKCGEINLKSIFSHGSSNSTGTAILFSDGFEFKLIKQYSDNDGRYIIIDIEHHYNIHTIVKGIVHLNIIFLIYMLQQEIKSQIKSGFFNHLLKFSRI